MPLSVCLSNFLVENRSIVNNRQRLRPKAKSAYFFQYSIDNCIIASKFQLKLNCFPCLHQPTYCSTSRDRCFHLLINTLRKVKSFFNSQKDKE